MEIRPTIIIWCILATFGFINGTPYRDMHNLDHGMLDPYTGEVMHRDTIQDKQNDNCILVISKNSSNMFKSLLEEYHPNLIHFKLWFSQENISATKEAILPFDWVWTYYSPKGYFPYLKWPVDFPILSFGLLAVKTLPFKSQTIYLDVGIDGECELTLGEKRTTHMIGKALMNMTYHYVYPLDRTSFSFSYWCYLTEVPNVKASTIYHISLYLGFPVNFYGYKCCRTTVPRTSGEMFVECHDHIVSKMFQVFVIPYIVGHIVFAYFPVLLMMISQKLFSYGKTLRGNIQDESSWEIVDANDEEWLYLDGNSSPITLSKLVCGMCGLGKRHPVAVSRVRRILFLLLSPCPVLAKLYAYSSFQFDLTMSLLDHRVPLGYLSMLAGFEKSKRMFIPAFGGPYVLLGSFLFLGIIFIVLPNDFNSIVHEGASRSQRDNRFDSPLFLDERAIEDLSGFKIKEQNGYGKAAAMCIGGLLMLTNPMFWSYLQQYQWRRYVHIYNNLVYRGCNWKIAAFVCVLCLPFAILWYAIEVCLCLIFYGIPSVRFTFITGKGYVCIITRLFINGERAKIKTRSRVLSSILAMTRNVCRYCSAGIIFGLFVYFVFCFCTIFISGFQFVAKLLMFSLVAVIVYPSNAFGYLFFGVALFYYIYKLLKAFGDGYYELLTDAVETSVHLSDELLHLQVVNGTVCLTGTTRAEIKRIQIHDKVVTLTPDQVMQLKEASPSQLHKIREKEHLVGIPRELFDILVKKYRPVHHQVAKSLLWLGFVVFLITVTISIIVAKNMAPVEGISEMMHILFIMVVGAVPEVLKLIIDKSSDHLVKKDIQTKKIKATIEEYWFDKQCY